MKIGEEDVLERLPFRFRVSVPGLGLSALLHEPDLLCGTNERLVACFLLLDMHKTDQTGNPFMASVLKVLVRVHRLFHFLIHFF